MALPDVAPTQLPPGFRVAEPDFASDWPQAEREAEFVRPRQVGQSLLDQRAPLTPPKRLREPLSHLAHMAAESGVKLVGVVLCETGDLIEQAKTASLGSPHRPVVEADLSVKARF